MAKPKLIDSVENNETIYDILSSWVFVLNTKFQNRQNACIVDSISIVNNVPKKIVMSISKKCLSAEFIKANPIFNLTAIGRDTPIDVLLDLGFDTGYKHNKMDHFPHKKLGRNQIFYIHSDYSLYYMECNSTDLIEEDDHYICIARIMSITELHPEIKPLSFHYYLKNIQPIIIKKLPQEQRCTVCGYIHQGSTPPAVCPVCGQPQEYFKPHVAYIKK
ncbi:MAG: hypothetical protein LBV22_03500 [Mycoplasmataceae bacterium]|jgi:flavin reductase (DIM6/NTAB) family NADH-FMN oxidoreductase RutF|nr:hypothetical protein [Mycoplasmataceae bacterium]